MTSSWWNTATIGVRLKATQRFQLPASPSRSGLIAIRARSPAEARTTSIVSSSDRSSETIKSKARPSWASML